MFKFNLILVLSVILSGLFAVEVEPDLDYEGLDLEDELDALQLESCQVTETGSGNETTCQFPFKLNGVEYLGCTPDMDPAGKLWCSTKINPETREHVGGAGLHWGYCEPEATCLVSEDVEAAQNFTVASATEELAKQDLETGNRENNDVACPCINYNFCPWSSKLIRYIAKLSKSEPIRGFLVDRIRENVCAKRAVFCCDFNAALKSTTTEKPPESEDTKFTNKRLGTWLPNENQCGQRLNSKHIVGGEVTKVGEYPFAALFVRKDDRGRDSYYCGGSVINKWYILTAAHCVAGSRPRRVVVGEHTLSTNPDCQRDTRGRDVFCAEPSITRGVADVTIHEDYQGNDRAILGNDIALVRVDKPIPMSADNLISNTVQSSVSPVCLPWRSGDPGHDLGEVDLTVIGWGRTTNIRRLSNKIKLETGAGTNVLLQLSVPKLNDDQCEAISLFEGLRKEVQFCAGGETDKDSCSGDSGGPLLYRTGSALPWYQVGIVSLGTNRCGIGFPGVYTRVTAFIPWIKENLKP